MAYIDRWTDSTAERALHLIRVAEAVVREMRRTYQPTGQGIRAVTVDRWLSDAVAFMEQHPVVEEDHAAATTD